MSPDEVITDDAMPEDGNIATLAEGVEEHIDPLKSWQILGSGIADWVTSTLEARLAKVTLLPVKALGDSNYLRAALGNIWLLFPVIGVTLGVLASRNAAGYGQVIPPVAWIFLAIMVLGVFDAASGLLAFLIYAVATIVAGDWGNLHSVAAIAGLGVMWFGGAQLAHNFRPVGLWDDEPSRGIRAWRIVGDLIILPVAGAFVLGKISLVFSYFVGLKVPIAEKETLVTAVAFGALFLRAAAESTVIHNYRNRIASIHRPRLPKRWIPLDILAFAVTVFIAYVFIWSFIGNTAQTFVILGIFCAFGPVTYLGRQFPESTLISRLTPKNLLKVAIIILAAEIIVREMGRNYSGNPTQVMGWAFVALGVVVLLFLVIEQFNGKPWPETWIIRILGAASIVFFVAVAQGWVAIAA